MTMNATTCTAPHVVQIDDEDNDSDDVETGRGS